MPHTPYTKLRPLQPFSGEPSSPLPLLQLPGRETSAGRALFALFNGYDLARKRGNLYSDYNVARIRHRPPDLCPPALRTPPRPPQKRTVKVPRFRRCQTIDPSQREPNHAAGRRKASDILRQLRIDLEHKELPPHPTTAEPLLDDKEKARLASLFEWSGRLDKDQLANMATLASQPPKSKHRVRVQNVPQGSVQEMENMVDQIAQEIQEREEFIREMDVLGQAEKYKRQVRFEIQQRVKEMEKLDKLIKAEENE